MAASEFSRSQLAEIYKLGSKTVQRIVGNDEWQKRQEARNSAKLKSDFDKITDEKHYQRIVWVIFCQHTVSANVEKRIDTIWKYLGDYKRNMMIKTTGQEDGFIDSMMNDNNMFKSKKKACAAIDNAFKFDEVVREHAGHGNYAFRAYVLSFHPWDEYEVDKLVDDMARRFVRFKRISAEHFLTHYGFPLIKPDSNIKRTFFRIGLIDNEDDDKGCVNAGRSMAEAAGVDVYMIDDFVLLGMKKGNEVCGHEPACQLCDIRPYCRYYKERYRSKPHS